MSPFQSPNYTQTPNDFFEMLPEMEHSEVNVTLVMIRQTFGFHRDDFKMGLNKLAAAAGLSRNAAKDGAEAAEKRGTFKRVNPDEQGEAEWSLVVEGGQSLTTPGQPVTRPSSVNDPQVGVKERIKKESKKINDNDENSQRLKTLCALYEENIGLITPMTADLLRNDVLDYPESWYKPAFEIAVKNNARNLKYIETILKSWKDHGFGWKPERVKNNSTRRSEPRAFDAIRQFEEMNNGKS